MPIRAAEYVRMSTDHQRYSIAHQQEANRAFAAKHDMTIVATYVDAGRSGVTVRRRPELRRLLADARRGTLACDVILVYDISRWGRFQDPDEGAFHEFVCKAAGYRVIYCAEPLTEDQGPFAALIKSLKRVMAGEFSRELSIKVHAAMERETKQGFWCAGNIGYGLRRAALGNDGTPVRILEAGQDRARRSEHTIVVLGPDVEVTAVRRVFNLYVNERYSTRSIATTMNSECAPPPRSGRWTFDFVRRILQHERYVGHLTWGKQSRKLGTPIVRTPPDQYVKVQNAIPAIIDNALFERAQARLRKREPRVHEDELLEELRQLLKRHGRLNAPLIENSKEASALKTYLRRFNNLSTIYSLVGWTPLNGRGCWDPEGLVRRHRRALSAEVVRRLRAIGANVRVGRQDYRLLVNYHLTVGISVIRECFSMGPANRWRVRRFSDPCPDVTVLARLDLKNERIIDYHLVPAAATACLSSITWMDSEGRSVLEPYRCSGLEELDRLVAGSRIAEDELEEHDVI